MAGDVERFGPAPDVVVEGLEVSIASKPPSAPFVAKPSTCGLKCLK